MMYGCFEKNNNSNKVDTDSELNITDYDELDISDYKTVGITKDFKIGNTTLTFISDGFDQKLYVGNLIIMESSNPYYNLDNIIYEYGDSFIFSANNKSSIYLFDALNQKLVSYEKFYENNLHTFECTMEMKGLTLKASAIIDGKLDLGNDVYETIDTCEKYNKYKDYMSDATIFVKYLGNSKFDGYRIISSHKVSDMPEYNKLCN